MGEFISENIFNFITLILIAVGGMASFVKLQSSVSHLGEKVDRLDGKVCNFEGELKTIEKEMIKHDGDDEKHVNHLFMRSLENKIDRIEEKLDKYIYSK